MVMVLYGVEGQLIVNEIALARQAARDGAGLAYLLRSAWRVLAEAIPAWREARPVAPEVLR